MNYEELGEKWLRGEIKIGEFNGYKLNPKQIEYVNAKERYVLSSGGMRSGKTLAFIIKLILLALFFPKNVILLGRDTRANLEKTTLRDFFDVCPKDLYEYKVGAGIIQFHNDSQIIIRGLQASASGSDIAGAEQEIKGMNLGQAFIDQVEEIDERIFNALTSRLSNRNGGIQQINMTTNPANFWGYDYFKAHPRPNTKLIEMSMLDNKGNLPPGYLEDQLQREPGYVEKYVYGKWDLSSMVAGSVFEQTFISEQDALVIDPISTKDDIHIFHTPIPGHEYQIGVDPSEGAVDPCAIVVVDKSNEDDVATFNEFVPVDKQVDVTVELGWRYNQAFVVPEINNTSGGAFLTEFKKKYNRIYERKTYQKWDDKNTSKLGFQTNHATKAMLIEHFRTALRERFPKLRDKRIAHELKTFAYTDEAKKKGAGAQAGFHDDLVMATMMAYWEVTPTKFYENKRKKVEEAFSLYSENYN